MRTSTGNEFGALNNGWVADASTYENLATSEDFHYLRRRVHSWGDLLRIRYGNGPEESKAWEYMGKYVRLMAKYFDGFRLDNLHGTQLDVGVYMMKEARKVNPDLLIFAELFTRNNEEKAHFTRSIGINSTMKEMVYSLNGN